MSKGDAVGLEWAIIAGELQNISQYESVTPSQRPEAFCPACGDVVIMKLGEKKRHHCAHQEGVKCITLTSEAGETILHLNTKFHIWSELQKAMKVRPNRLFVSIACGYCGTQYVKVLTHSWDDVQVEYRINPYRPDIVMLKNGKPIGAVEIFVTHKVPPEKEKYFLENEIRWIEVEASKVYSEKTKWKYSEPLEGNIPSVSFLCSGCNQRNQKIAWLAQEAKRQQSQYPNYREHEKTREMIDSARDPKWLATVFNYNNDPDPTENQMNQRYTDIQQALRNIHELYGYDGIAQLEPRLLELLLQEGMIVYSDESDYEVTRLGLDFIASIFASTGDG